MMWRRNTGEWLEMRTQRLGDEWKSRAWVVSRVAGRLAAGAKHAVYRPTGTEAAAQCALAAPGQHLFPQQTSTANCGGPHLRATCREPQYRTRPAPRRLALCQSHTTLQVPWTRLGLVKHCLFSARRHRSRLHSSPSRSILPRQQIAPALPDVCACQNIAPASPQCSKSDVLYHKVVALPCRSPPPRCHCYTATHIHTHAASPSAGSAPGASCRTTLDFPAAWAARLGSISLSNMILCAPGMLPRLHGPRLRITTALSHTCPPD